MVSKMKKAVKYILQLQNFMRNNSSKIEEGSEELENSLFYYSKSSIIEINVKN